LRWNPWRIPLGSESQGTPTRIWAKLCGRPRIRRDRRFTWAVGIAQQSDLCLTTIWRDRAVNGGVKVGQRAGAKPGQFAALA